MFKKGNKVIVDCKCGYKDCIYQNVEGVVGNDYVSEKGILIDIGPTRDLIFQTKYVRFANIEIFGELGD